MFAKKTMIKITYQRRTKLSGIYCIKNDVTGKLYIGSSKHIMSRIFGGSSTSHIRALLSNNHINHHLQGSWNTHGEKSFSYYILELCNPKDLISREQYYFNTLLKANELPDNRYFYEHSYNLCPEPGKVAGKKHTPKGIKNMSKSKIGEKNPMYGKKGDLSPYSLKILQYGLDRVFIKEWSSTRTASEQTGVTIAAITNSAQKNKTKGIRYTGGGYCWIYKENDDIKQKLEVDEFKKSKAKRVC
jgi:group I intron endonuclease